MVSSSGTGGSVASTTAAGVTTDTSRTPAWPLATAYSAAGRSDPSQMP